MRSGTTANDLENIQFTSEDRAIAVGQRGAIVVSEDGGQTWEEIDADIWDNIRNIFFISTKRLVKRRHET